MEKLNFKSTTNIRRKPVWSDISGRFSRDRDCLAAFLTLETAEILSGVKPSNLINLANRSKQCGRNFYALWKEHGIGLIGESCLEVRELADRGDSLLLLLYRKDLLENLLCRSNVINMLRMAGYREELDIESVVSELRTRLADGGFPHEIGIFLGYPLKDVAGFLGWGRLPCSGCGPWRMYGNPSESLRLAKTFSLCRRRMARRLLSSGMPYDCLRPDDRKYGHSGGKTNFRAA